MGRIAPRMPFTALAAIPLLAWCAPALALRPTVVDGGDFFKPPAIDKANETIRQIKQRYGKDLMIETYREVPADMREEFQKKGKEGFYADWLTRRARALGVNGVFVLVTRNPGRLQIGVGGGGEALKLFTPRDRDELRQMMLAEVRQERFDEALLRATEFVRDRMERNAGPPIAAANGGGPAAVGPPQPGTPGTPEPVRPLPTDRPMPGNPPATAPVTLALPATIPSNGSPAQQATQSVPPPGQPDGRSAGDF